MMKFSASSLRSLFNPSLSKVTLVGVLSATSLLTGFAPQFSQPQAAFGSVAYAQADPVAQYARAAYQIERLRQQKFGQAKKLAPNLPADPCRQQDIPQPVRSICNSFLSESTEIVKKNGLSISQFNEITRRKDSDPSLQQQIRQEMQRLQGQ